MEILKEIWNGLSPKEKAFYEDAAYTEAMHRLTEQDALFRATLSQEQVKMLNAMQNEEAALSNANRQNMFLYGFRMANAKAKGKKIGRPHATKDSIPAAFYRHYPAYQKGQLNLSELARVCNLSRTTVYKYLSLLEQ